MNRDQLTSVGIQQAGQDAFAVVDKVQRMPTKARRLMAIVNALNCACRGLDVDPVELLEISDNYLMDGERTLRPEFGGAVQYFSKHGDKV